MDLDSLYNKVLNNEPITKEEALFLYNQPIEELADKANKIRIHFCNNKFDICTIINAKSGCCSENCKFCAQSIHNLTNIETYPLKSVDEIVNEAKINYSQGIMRYSIVTSGRRISDSDLDTICLAVRRIVKEVGISVCASLGLLNEAQFKKLKDSGVSRMHNNLETSNNYFNNICSTHTFLDKINSIKAAQDCGLTVCSGGIMGLGEEIVDRIDMAFTLRDLGIKSIPINILNPIKGTPLENNKRITNEEIRRIVAVYRFILPDSYIRLAGGRKLLDDFGKLSFQSGANAAITGNMLTTMGVTIDKDMKMLDSIGYIIGE